MDDAWSAGVAGNAREGRNWTIEDYGTFSQARMYHSNESFIQRNVSVEDEDQ